MPIYEFKCKRCRKVTEQFHSVDGCPQSIKCSCGKMAKKIISRGSIQCDSLNDVKWLPSACQTLQPDGERPITSRTEHKKYLRDHGIQPKA